MSNITRLHSIGSCMPFIGPFIGNYNNYKIRQIIGNDPLRTSLLEKECDLNKNLVNDLENDDNLNHTLTASIMNALTERYLPLAYKGRICTAGQIVGSLLTIISTISLYSVKFFKPLSAGVIVGLSLYDIVICCKEFYKYHRLVKLFDAE